MALSKEQMAVQEFGHKDNRRRNFVSKLNAGINRSKDDMEREAEASGIKPGMNSVDSLVSVSPQAVKGTKMEGKTIDQYMRRAESLRKRYRRESGLFFDDETDPVEFVNWLLSLKETLQASTWRVYRQSVYYYLNGSPSDNRDRALSMLEDDIIDLSTMPKKNKDRKTSASREKRFPLDDWKRVLTFLTRFSRSDYAPILVDWLRAGMYTGLRPNEWKMTDIKENNGKIILHVLSCKNTNGRTTGAVRTLDLSHMEPDQIRAIKSMSDYGNLWRKENRFSQVQGQCSHLMHKVVQKLFPRRKYFYSLYSTRHQFIANLKASGMPQDEMAAIVGHGSTATAETHYGKRRSGWGEKNRPPTPIAIPEEVSIVRERRKIAEDRIQMEIDAGLRRKK